VNAPFTSNPPMMRGRRPTVSATREDTGSTEAFPIAKSARTAPAIQGSGEITTAANRGTRAMRTPKLLHPLAKPLPSTERKALSDHASRRVRTSAPPPGPSPWERRGGTSSIAPMNSAATNRVPAYTRKGTRIPNCPSSPPMTGPTMLPIRNIEPYRAETRPRIVGGASRTSRPIAETVNITEPIPPRERNTSNCQ